MGDTVMEVSTIKSEEMEILPRGSKTIRLNYTKEQHSELINEAPFKKPHFCLTDRHEKSCQVIAHKFNVLKLFCGAKPLV